MLRKYNRMLFILLVLVVFVTSFFLFYNRPKTGKYTKAILVFEDINIKFAKA